MQSEISPSTLKTRHRRSFRQNDIAFVVFSYLFIFVLKWNKHCCSTLKTYKICYFTRN